MKSGSSTEASGTDPLRKILTRGDVGAVADHMHTASPRLSGDERTNRLSAPFSDRTLDRCARRAQQALACGRLG